jgi:AraC-like DNA-binding protein
MNSGFGDVFNFNRAFRGEFGVSPRRFRNQAHASAGNGSSRLDF